MRTFGEVHTLLSNIRECTAGFANIGQKAIDCCQSFAYLVAAGVRRVAGTLRPNPVPPPAPLHPGLPSAPAHHAQQNACNLTILDLSLCATFSIKALSIFLVLLQCLYHPARCGTDIAPTLSASHSRDRGLLLCFLTQCRECGCTIGLKQDFGLHLGLHSKAEECGCCVSSALLRTAIRAVFRERRSLSPCAHMISQGVEAAQHQHSCAKLVPRLQIHTKIPHTSQVHAKVGISRGNNSDYEFHSCILPLCCTNASSSQPSKNSQDVYLSLQTHTHTNNATYIAAACEFRHIHSAAIMHQQASHLPATVTKESEIEACGISHAWCTPLPLLSAPFHHGPAAVQPLPVA